MAKEEMFSKLSVLNKVKKKARSHLKNEHSFKMKQRYSGFTWNTDSKGTKEMFEDTGVGFLLPSEPYDDLNYTFQDVSYKSTNEMLMEIGIFTEPIMNQQSVTEEVDESHAGKLFGEDLILFRRPQDQSERIDQTKKLSDEILLEIFRLLPRETLVCCAKVCRRWRNVSAVDSLWKTIDLRKRYLIEGQLGYVINKNVAILSLASAKIETPIFDFSTFQNEETRLQYLDLSMAHVSKEGIAEILSYCCRLVKLSLESCEVDEHVFRALSHNHELKVLNLAMCQGITYIDLLNLANSCKKLVSLNLAWTNLCMLGYENLFCYLSPGLKELNISGARENLASTSIAMLSAHCPNLVELDVSDAHSIGPEAVEFIINRLAILQRLHVSYCYSVPIESYVALSKLQYLKVLSVRGLFTEDVLQMLRESLPNVQINAQAISTIARPASLNRQNTIWGIPLI